MAKKKEETAPPEVIDETAVSKTETTPSASSGQAAPRNLIGAAIDHMTLAAQMLRSKGGKTAESCAYVAGQLDRWVTQLEKLNE
jgi:hypothetical protein